MRSLAWKSWLAMGTALLAVAIPTAAGFAFVLDPLSERNRLDWFPVYTSQAVPLDGTPLRVKVRIPQRDAWSRLPDAVIGHVFLRRDAATSSVVVLNSLYHGCGVEYEPDSRRFFVPCWNVHFDLSGRRLHSIQAWGDLGHIRSQLIGDRVFIHLSDLTAGRVTP